MFGKHKLDTVTKTPTLLGTAGRAWELDFDALATYHNMSKELAQGNCVVLWFIEAPYAHMLWHTYYIEVLKLDRLCGDTLYLPDATHEMSLWAVDPAADRNKLLLLSEKKWKLTPGNFAAQFIAASDEDAKIRIAKSVQDIIDAQLSPDTDYIKVWMDRWGDNMIKSEFRATAGDTSIVFQSNDGAVNRITLPGTPAPSTRKDVN